jgi:hypothetical protein
MLRSIKSGQRKVRILAIKISNSGVVSGPDSKKVSYDHSTKIVSFNQSFAEAPVAIGSYIEQSGNALSAFTETPVLKGTITASQCQVAFDANGTPDIELLIIGSDTTEKY